MSRIDPYENDAPVSVSLKIHVCFLLIAADFFCKIFPTFGSEDLKTDRQHSFR